MSTGKTIKKSKQITDAAATGVKLLKGYQDAAAALEKEGKTLSDMQSAVKALTFIGKLNTGLAMLSLGLTVAQMIFPVKSPQAQILEEIGKLSQKLDAIKADIQKLGKKLDLSRTQALAVDAASKIDLINTHYIEYGKSSSDEDYEVLADKETAKSLDKALNDLKLSLTGTGESPALLKAVYEQSKGQVEAVTKHAFFVKHNAELCVQIWAVCDNALKKKKALAKGEPWGEAESEASGIEFLGDIDSDTSVSGRLRVISENCNEWAVKGLGTTERDANIKATLKASFVQTAPAHQQYQLVAERIIAELTLGFPWMDFSVICYDGISGAYNHSWYKGAGNSSLITFLKQPDDDGDTVDILVLASPARNGRIREPYKLEDAFALKDTSIGPGGFSPKTLGDQRKFTLYEFTDFAVKMGRDWKYHGDISKYLKYWPIFRVCEGHPPSLLKRYLEFYETEDLAWSPVNAVWTDKERETFHKLSTEWKGDFVWMGAFGAEPGGGGNNFGFVSQMFAAGASKSLSKNKGHFGGSFYHKSVGTIYHGTCLHICPDGF